MIAEVLIRQAKESGVALRLVGSKVKASGPRDAVSRLLVLLRENRAMLAEALQTDPMEPFLGNSVAAVSEHTDWHLLAATYHAHHFSCPTCIAAGRGSLYGHRCDTGMVLWRAYSQWPVSAQN